jgi:hypothetical protein
VTDDLGNVLFLTDLTHFPSDDCESDIGICDGTFAGVNRPFEPLDPAATQIATASATIVISDVVEPGSLWLLGWPGALWIILRRRRWLGSQAASPILASQAH